MLQGSLLIPLEIPNFFGEPPCVLKIPTFTFSCIRMSCAMTEFYRYRNANEGTIVVEIFFYSI